MKKPFYILVCIILLTGSGSLSAQFYVHFNTGYSFATNPYVQQNRVVADSVMDLFRIRFGYGKGVNVSLSGGYRFNEHFSAELLAATAFMTASTSDNNWEKYFAANYVQLHLTGLNGNARMTNSSLQIAPLIVFTAKTGKFEPFIKAGVNFLFLKSRFKNDYTYEYYANRYGYYLTNTKLKREYTGGMSVGFRGSIGVRYPLSERLAVSAEFMAVNNGYRFTRLKYTSYVIDNLDQIDTLQENPEKLTGNEGLVDFSNIGFNFGLIYKQAR